MFPQAAEDFISFLAIHVEGILPAFGRPWATGDDRPKSRYLGYN